MRKRTDFIKDVRKWRLKIPNFIINSLINYYQGPIRPCWIFIGGLFIGDGSDTDYLAILIA